MTRQPPDPELMEAARMYYAHAAACDAAGLKAEAQKAQEAGTRKWMAALGRPDTVQETRR